MLINYEQCSLILKENDFFKTVDVIGYALPILAYKNLGNNRTQMDNFKPEINSRLCDNTLKVNVSSPTLSSHSTNFDVIPDENNVQSSSIPNCNLKITNVSNLSTDTVDHGVIKIEKSAAFTNNIYNENQTLPIIMSKCNENIIVTSKPITTPENSRRNKLRLSISGFCNNSIPSVHERLNGIPSRNGNQAKTRLSTHQRNLSLDFRSMGILLPPVSHVTNTRVNITQHHRNRSLDSALQRIPEVEVSSPNAENEHNFSANSFLGPTVCSKMTPLLLSSTTTAPITSTSSIKSKNCPSDVHRIILKKNDSQSASNLNTGVDPVLTTTSEATDKKREELTSLGSDDSGIICGSESDQVSLNRVRRSRESLDSGEVDPEEECIGIPAETAAVSMNEECGISDLSFNQNSKENIKSIKTRKKMHENEKDHHVENELQKSDVENLITSCLSPDNKVSLIANIDDDDDNKPEHCMNFVDDTSMPLENAELAPIEENNKCVDSATATTASGISSKSELTESSKFEHIKSEILFKNFFGATKNVIFRTAQSIIDNHEKKSLLKNNKSDELCDMKSSSSDISKKKEFFVLKPISIKNKMGSTISTKNVVPEVNEINQNQLTTTIKLSQACSDIGNSLQKKVKVPGVVRCFVDDKKQQQQKQQQQNILQIEKNSHTTGLLRFFESPVFNIHFAIHYLFYSKEPGVLSFIGNKIFSFPDHNVDLYIPQLIVMYIQMDELAEVLDPYLTYRCKKSVDFSLKCLWLFEAYNYNLDDFSSTSTSNKKMNLSLIKELYSKRERVKCVGIDVLGESSSSSLINKKTHHRSQSDATGLLNNSKCFSPSSTTLKLQSKVCSSTTPTKLCLGDLTSGKAFDNGCTCFKSVQGTVNDLLGHKTFCYCGAPKMAPQKEFMKALINVGKNLTTLRTKAEKTSALRLFLNLINKNLPARVWLPLYSDIPHHIVRITEEKTAVLNSKDKTPYIIYVEVVEVDDVFTSPLIMKMMPTLRHTKSEEHLESTNLNLTTKRSLIINSNSEANIKKQQIQEQQQQENNSDGCTIATEKRSYFTESNFTEDDVWSQEDDEITAQYLNLCRNSERDAISQISLDSYDSKDQGSIALFNIGDVRTRHFNNLICENTKSFSNDPEDPSAAALKEPWHEKEKQIRSSSPYGHLFSWRLLSAIVKCGDDLRQELMATQLLQMFKIIWEEENIDLWVRPYKVVCFSNDSGLIEPILNTVSLHQIKKNSNKSLRDYFIDEYGDDVENLKFKKAQRNFMQSCAAYCLISYLLQVKDRHNGNILLHSDGHLIHIDFGFILSTSPKNLGFEQSPFKLTPEFVDVMGGTSSELWTEFNYLLLKGLMAARKHMDRIINLVEIMRSNSQLPCFKSGCSGTVQNLRKRFHMNLTEQELEKKVEQLVQDSLKSLSTKLYDGYQYLTNGIL